MNKAQLLVDLATKDGVDRLIGDPVDVTPSGDVGVCKVYQQAYLEARGSAGLKQTKTFYVFSEGDPAEVAYYQNIEPDSQARVQLASLYAWMRDTIDADPDSFKAIQIHWLSERYEMVVYSTLVDDGGGGLEWETRYIRKGSASKVISNHDAAFLRSVMSI